MEDYDSDSSGAGNGEIQTNVLLGYVSKDPTGDDFSQVGGLPTWIDQDSPPSGTYARCSACNEVMSLLLQLHGDLPAQFPGHERRLYVFGCRRKVCRRKQGCVRVLRGVRVNEARAFTEQKNVEAETEPELGEHHQPPRTNLGEKLFGVTNSTSGPANPFATPSSTDNVGNPFASSKSVQTSSTSSTPATASPALAETFAQKVRISNPSPLSSDAIEPTPNEPWPIDPQPYPSYYVDADKEYLEPDIASHDIPSNARLDTSGEGSGSGSAADDKAAFESSLDKTFQRFADRLAQNPEQVLRYDFAGEPLLYSSTDAVGKLLSPATGNGGKVQSSSSANGTTSVTKMPRCRNCGATRVFELQLTPHAITELEADEMGLEGMDWGTIVIGVCSEDCQDSKTADQPAKVSYVEEWAGVQWEEIAAMGKGK